MTSQQLDGLDLVTAMKSRYGPVVKVRPTWTQPMVMLTDPAATRRVVGNRENTERPVDILGGWRGHRYNVFFYFLFMFIRERLASYTSLETF